MDCGGGERDNYRHISIPTSVQLWRLLYSPASWFKEKEIPNQHTEPGRNVSDEAAPYTSNNVLLI